MNKLFLAPTTLVDAAPLDFLAAAAGAGYDGVGVRLYRSPNLPFHPVVGNAGLIRQIERALADAGLAPADVSVRVVDAVERHPVTAKVRRFVPLT